jgi:hypothetical protein
LKYGNEPLAMFLVGDQNLPTRHWVQESAVSLSQVEQYWPVTPLSPSTAPGFISKGVRAIAALQSEATTFSFICLCIKSFDSLMFKLSLKQKISRNQDRNDV